MKGKLRAPRRPSVKARRFQGSGRAPRLAAGLKDAWQRSGGLKNAPRLAGGVANALRKSDVKGVARLAQTVVQESRLSIRVKLMAATGVVLALLAIVGVIGWVNTRSFANDFSKLYDDRLVPLVQIGEAEAALMDLRAGVQVYENAGPIIRDKVIKSREAQRQQIEEQMQAYAKTDLAPEAKELLVAWDKAYTAYITAADQHKDMINSDGAMRADLLNRGTMEPRYQEAMSTLKRLKEVQRNAGAQMNASVSARADRTNMIVAGTVVVALIVGLGVAGTLAWVIAGSTTQVTKAARGLAQGDLNQKVNVRSRDELGELASAFHDMMAYMQEMADVAGAVARGDLSRTLEPKSERDVLGTAFQGMINDLRQLVAEVQESAGAVAEASGQLGPAALQASAAVNQVSGAVRGIAEGAQQTTSSARIGYEAMDQLARAIEGIARGAGDQAQQVQAASAIATEMATSVERVSTSAGRVAQVSADARTAAQQGAGAVRETVDGMHEIKAVVTQAAVRVEELGKLGQKIGAVVETIDDIAEQTNLLALNAAIEAARAGEHGRGFAVVADEVRKLAERSQNETKAISQLIRDVRNGTNDAVKSMQSGSAKVEAGVRLADQAGDSLARILSAVEATVDQAADIAQAARELEAGAVAVVEAMEGISAVVEENTATSEEMAAESSHVTEAIQSIGAVAEQNSAVTEEVSASAQEMSAQVERIGGQARELSTTAEHLRSLVARFTLDASGESEREEQQEGLRLVA